MAIFQVMCDLQQAGVLRDHTGMETGGYVGSMGVDFWKENEWKQQLAKQQVMVMTHQILLNSLRHGFIKVNLSPLHHFRLHSPPASDCFLITIADWQ